MKFFLSLLSDLRAVLVSLRLTVALLLMSIILVLIGTLEQVKLGIWAVQSLYFNTFIVFWHVGDMSLAVFPGGYTLGGLLLINLVAAQATSFQLSWRKLGIWLTHAGLILLLIGQMITAVMQDEFHMRLAQGETKNFSESYHAIELVLTDVTDPNYDDVVAIPEKPLEQKKTVQHPKLPFRVAVKTYLPNASLQRAQPGMGAPTSPANQGFGPQILVQPEPMTYKEGERNVPSAYVELIGPEGSLGTWLVSPMLESQSFSFGGRTWTIELRPVRHYKPYSLTLLKFSHDRYAGTDIPKNFSSRLRLTTADGKDDREVLIYMNNPLRYAGLTFYQAGFENNDTTTILQVVRNPGWLVPYIACVIMTLGLSWQFGLHLIGFIGKRRRGPAAPTPAGSKAAKAATPATPAAPARWTAGRLVATLIPALAALWVVATLFPGKPKSEFALNEFGRLPTLVNGRVKPLDTVARTTLLMFQGRQSVTTFDGRRLGPNEWLLDMLFRPTLANTYPVIEIVHPEVLSLVNVTAEQGAGKKRFSHDQLLSGLVEIDRQARLADAVESAIRTPFQQAVVQLRNSIALYQRLQESVISPGSTEFLDQLARFPQEVATGTAADEAKKAGASVDAVALKRWLDLRVSIVSLEQRGYLNLIPSDHDAIDLTKWRNTGGALRSAIERGQLDPATASYVSLGLAWRDQKPEAFNAAAKAFRATLEPQIAPLLRKSDLETRFNAAQPFYTSTVLYVAAFLLAVFAWLKWPEPLGRASFGLMALAFALTTAGIGMRMWLEGRPPVTNLYSSALFVGWGAVGLCLILERLDRRAVAGAAGSVIGFTTLIIAHHLSLSGDTLEMMRAVLDSNFWLATHVITITVGYSATFLAGFLATIYILRGTFTKSLDKATADSLTKMVYGILCFATLFSFVGTVLGGIWADQSWGRFWGWDPKENGALIIVLWCALILHARWGGLVKQRGLMALAVFGNVVTAWSWFGTNMLGVGLHSYGFTNAAFLGLLTFVISQLVLIALVLLPVTTWRSSKLLARP